MIEQLRRHRAALDTQYQIAEAHLIREALHAAGWRLSVAALALDCPQSTLRSRLARYPELDLEYHDRSPGRGRPRKAVTT